jgi:hypothetical protein
MKRLAMSFGISLALVLLLCVAARASLLANVFIFPGLKLSSYLVPESAWAKTISDLVNPSPWLWFYAVFGLLIDALLLTWPVLFALRFVGRRLSK